MMKTKHHIGTDGLRPKVFATGPAIKQPISVPIESCKNIILALVLLTTYVHNSYKNVPKRQSDHF